MRERDSEDLAIEQLPRAGHADDLQLALAKQTLGEPVQEQAAVRSELNTQQRDQRALAVLDTSLDRLHAQRSALPAHKLAQLDDAEARLRDLTSQRDRQLQALEALPEAPPQRLLARKRGPHELERSRLAAAIGAYDDELKRAGAHRARLHRELGDPEQVRSEHAGLDRAIEEIRGRYDELRERLAEHHRDAPTPHDPVPRDRGEETERRITHDLDLGL
jgi:chromosome segregation ATPase